MSFTITSNTHVRTGRCPFPYVELRNSRLIEERKKDCDFDLVEQRILTIRAGADSKIDGASWSDETHRRIHLIGVPKPIIARPLKSEGEVLKFIADFNSLRQQAIDADKGDIFEMLGLAPQASSVPETPSYIHAPKPRRYPIPPPSKNAMAQILERMEAGISPHRHQSPKEREATLAAQPRPRPPGMADLDFIRLPDPPRHAPAASRKRPPGPPAEERPSKRRTLSRDRIHADVAAHPDLDPTPRLP